MGKTYAWHVHHEILYEPLTEPLKKRADFIKSSKPSTEQATRLRLLREVKDQRRIADLDAQKQVAEKVWKRFDDSLDEVKTARGHALDGAEKKATAAAQTAIETESGIYLAIDELHRAECEPDCQWNGRTIFPGKA